MIPSNSNFSKENCSPISSNCIVWQGRDISCINLCTGDTISDVTYKLAEEICELKENIGISDIDLTKIVKVCQETPQPSKTLANILQLFISKIVCIDEIIKDLPEPGQSFQEPTLNYPNCSTFSGLTNDLLTDFVVTLAQKICSIGTTVATNTSSIAALTTRVVTLEGLVPTPLPNLASCLSGATQPLNVVLQNLEIEFCDIKDALGDDGNLNTARSRICPNLGGEKRLTDSTKVMNTITGWEGNPQNFAQSVNNLWLTVCDIRAAVRSILDNCCKAGCDDILIDFYQRWSSEDDGILLINFRAKSNLPVGFYDCGQSSTLPNTTDNSFTFTDALGVSIPYPVLFRSINYPSGDKTGLLDDPDLAYGWFPIDLSTTGLDLEAGPITMSSDLCFTDGTIECIKCVNFTISPKPYVKCCEVKATAPVTIIYKTC
jgi:hypothetical protein